jgi:hypothetical protein
MNRDNLWVLYPKPDSFVHEPGKQIKIGLTVQNLSDTALYFSKAEVAPSWANGRKGIKLIEKHEYLPARSSIIFLTDFYLTLPQEPGLYSMRFGLETWVYNYYTADWKNLGVLWTSDWGYIQITPQPIYKVFVSQSNRPEDSPVVNQIVNIIELWGFEPKTVGIEEFSEDPSKIFDDIERKIGSLDALIAICTPRDYNLQEKSYKTLGMTHVESTMAFKDKKPMIFIVDERIKPEGLLEDPRFPKVYYHPTKLEVLEHRLAIVMPGFRKWIAEKKQQQFWDGLVKAGLILGGIWLAGKAMEEKE